MAPHATASSGLEAFGKAKSGSGSPSKERGDCKLFWIYNKIILWLLPVQAGPPLQLLN
jgi:hypothetical protein